MYCPSLPTFTRTNARVCGQEGGVYDTFDKTTTKKGRRSVQQSAKKDERRPVALHSAKQYSDSCLPPPQTRTCTHTCASGVCMLSLLPTASFCGSPRSPPWPQCSGGCGGRFQRRRAVLPQWKGSSRCAASSPRSCSPGGQSRRRRPP